MRDLTKEEQVSLVGLNLRIADMQDCVFFIQDDEGVLRRWHPPRPIKFQEAKDVRS